MHALGRPPSFTPLVSSARSALPPPTKHPRSAYGLAPLVEEEIERETAHQRLRLGDGVEFRIGEGSDGLMARGALPKGTSRK